MKLATRTFLDVFLVLTVVFLLWGMYFNRFINDRTVDEIDDQLEHYSDRLIRHLLMTGEMPLQSAGSNNEFFLSEVDEGYLLGHERVEYTDQDVFIEWIGEEEPARVLRTVFEKEDGSLWLLTVLTPSYERDELKSAIAWACALLLLLLMLCVGVALVWAFWRNMRPMYRLLHWLDGYAIGATEKKLENDTSISEFRQLNETVTDCFDRIERAYERERRFIGDASHEMQTPLAICQNRVEMLMEDEHVTEPQMVELMKTQQTLSELSRLNKSLLLLSKIENNQFIEQTDVCMNELVHHFVEMYADVFEAMNVTMDVAEEAQWHVEANEPLMTTLVSNLLRNAYIHNVEGGRISVIVREDELEIGNTGIEEPLDSTHIFERFYRRDRNKKGSSGLGLSIVKAICDVSGIQIDYRYEDGLHRFRLKA